MSHHALALAVSIALCTHIVIYALLNLWPAPEAEHITKSIPVTLISAGSNSSKSPQTPPPASRPKTSSSEVSSQQHSKTKTSERQPDTTTKENRPSHAENSHNTDMPSRNQLQQNKRSSTASIGSLFQSQKGEQKKEIVINTKENDQIMSDYEQSLLKHLLKSKLYDSFNQFMMTSRTKDIAFQLELLLFANGAIRSAKIIEKNQELDIDRLVVTAAYNASPYPRPPVDDANHRFRYVVKMSYVKDHFEVN